MWKKDDPAPDPAPDPAHGASPQARPPIQPAASDSRTATIGPSISIKGDIAGDEDLVIEGRVEGAVQLQQHNVTVSSSARVVADIHGKRIYIDGEVTGDLFGEEVVIRKSGRVNGNAKAPRVTLENGCHFRGSIDMKPANGAQAAGSSSRDDKQKWRRSRAAS